MWQYYVVPWRDATRCGILTPMTEDAKQAAMARLRRAAARVSRHEAERLELADAIVEARRLDWRPSEIQDVVPYDRNHVGRILKNAGLTQPKGSRSDDT
jgi:hypothetical protein